MLPDRLDDELGRFSPAARKRALAGLLRTLARSCPACGASMRTATTTRLENGRLVRLVCPDCGHRRKIRD